MKKPNRFNRILALGLTTSLAMIAIAPRAFAAPLTDPSYQFDPSKLAVAADAFHFLRSFVDYFYLLIKTNEASLPAVVRLSQTPGWCVGDAHPENFGVILQQNGSALFAMNDMDDGGPCPIGLDLVRLMVSSRLYSPNVDLGTLVHAYVQGLNHASFAVPSTISEMLTSSPLKGMTPKKGAIQGKRLNRTAGMEELSDTELTMVRSTVENLPTQGLTGAKLLDAVSTRKVGGGSGGLLRYEILLKLNGSLFHLELKEEVTPSIYPVATAAIPDTATRISHLLDLEQPGAHSIYYSVLHFNGKDFLMRPRFAGNIGIDLSKAGGNETENLNVIQYEAYTLGTIHARTIGDVNSWLGQMQSIPVDQLESDIQALTADFTAKYHSLK